MDPPPSGDRNELIVALVADHGDWLLVRCAKAAAGWAGFDKFDVYQETIKRLLTSSMRVDPGNKGLRTFLSLHVEWATRDLIAKHAKDKGVELPPEEFDAKLEQSAAERLDQTPDSDGPGRSVSAMIADAPLSDPQANAIGNECGEPGLPAKEFALMVGRSYSQIRKDKERGLRNLHTWLGLTEDEEKAFIAVRRYGSVGEAARFLGRPAPEIRALFAGAQRKIDRKLNERRADPDVP